jgi:hypothetical protein
MPYDRPPIKLTMLILEQGHHEGARLACIPLFVYHYDLTREKLISVFLDNIKLVLQETNNKQTVYNWLLDQFNLESHETCGDKVWDHLDSMGIKFIPDLDIDIKIDNIVLLDVYSLEDDYND